MCYIQDTIVVRADNQVRKLHTVFQDNPFRSLGSLRLEKLDIKV